MPNSQRGPWLVIGLTTALAVAGAMTLHTVRHVIHMRRSTEPVRPWMSIPYIAHSHHVPMDALFAAVGLPPDHRDRRPLSRIARQEHKTVEELIANVQAAIDRERGHSPPASKGNSP